jgi:uncharacterized membrane protein YhaH (DUF805 family)
MARTGRPTTPQLVFDRHLFAGSANSFDASPGHWDVPSFWAAITRGQLEFAESRRSKRRPMRCQDDIRSASTKTALSHGPLFHPCAPVRHNLIWPPHLEIDQWEPLLDRNNPYSTPRAELDQPYAGGSDQTSPFSPAGRFGRLSYIAWSVLVSITAQIVELAVGGTALLHPKLDAAGQPLPPDLSPLTVALIVPVALVALVLAVLFMIRRLHDVDGSGWWALLVLVPLVNLVFALYLLLKPGTLGPNRFGPPRETAGWEKVVGYIGIALLVLIIIGIVAALLIPVLMGHGSVAS